MAGTIAPGRMTPRAEWPGRGTQFAVADLDDEADIRRLLRENPMSGPVTAGFEREPDYFRGVGIAGGSDETIIGRKDGRIVCVGRCTRRECWVAGSAEEVAYLAELRLDAGVRRRFAIVRDGYRFFRERQSGGLHFTSIAADNERARRLLESSVRGLPRYDPIGDLITVLVAVPRRPKPHGPACRPAGEADLPAIVALLESHGRRQQLATVWTEARLRSLAEYGLPLDRLFVLMDGRQPVVCGGLWDQRGFRQTMIHGYSGALRVARPFLNLANRAVGRPSLPAPGSALAQAFLSPLAQAEGADALLPDFVASLFPVARAGSIDWLTLALPAGDPRVAQLMRRFSIRIWPCRLYRVNWADTPSPSPLDPGLPILPDIALL